jgi:F-type H+-transporting ATPase subunit epsilon
VLGILAEGSLVEILDPEEGSSTQGSPMRVAVRSGFLSVHDDRVSILAREAELGSQVDRAAVQSRLDAALGEAGSGGDEESAEVKYSRALLRAAGDRS